jgi:hypothetical protein
VGTVTLAQAAAHVATIGRDLDAVALRASHRAAQYGKRLVVAEAVEMFGPDRRPHNWRKGRKTVNARYTIKQSGGVVSGVLYPTGDPFYVFTVGRHRGSYTTKRGNRKGYPAMAGRPEHWHRITRVFIPRYPELVHAETTRLLVKLYGH